MGRFVNRPIWLTDRFEICAEAMIQSVDEAFGTGKREIPDLISPGADLPEEVRTEFVRAFYSLDLPSQLKDIDTYILSFCITDEAFLYLLPSIARLGVQVNDLDCWGPGEDPLFTQGILDRCDLVKNELPTHQQAVLKEVVQLMEFMLATEGFCSRSQGIWADVETTPAWNQLFQELWRKPE